MDRGGVHPDGVPIIRTLGPVPPVQGWTPPMARPEEGPITTPVPGLRLVVAIGAMPPAVWPGSRPIGAPVPLPGIPLGERGLLQRVKAEMSMPVRMARSTAKTRMATGARTPATAGSRLSNRRHNIKLRRKPDRPRGRNRPRCTKKGRGRGKLPKPVGPRTCSGQSSTNQGQVLNRCAQPRNERQFAPRSRDLDSQARARSRGERLSQNRRDFDRTTRSGARHEGGRRGGRELRR